MPLLPEQMEVLLLRLKLEGAGNIPRTRRAEHQDLESQRRPKQRLGMGCWLPLLSPEWEQQGRLG